MLRAVFALILLTSAAAQAGTDTLPEGIRSASIRQAWVRGLDNTYGSDGGLAILGDKKSITFDAATLARVDARAQNLVQLLNSFGQQDLGSKIHLGTLKIDTQPEVNYTAPVFAYGIDDRWTLGMGLPVVRYRNRMNLSATGSNADVYRSQLAPLGSSALDSALNTDLVTAARQALASKGYRPLENRDETYLGDVQLAVLHRLPVSDRVQMLHQMTLVLPTGPRYDTDDLMALNVFGRTAIENSLAVDVRVSRRWTLRPLAALSLPLPDNVEMRVPRDEDDSLPDSSQKERVTRWLGPTVSGGGEAEYLVTRDWSVLGGASLNWKLADRYWGEGRTDLLARDTAGSATRVKAGTSYTTVNLFKRKQFAVPGLVSLEVSDTIAGVNVERQLKAEMNLMLFF